MSTVNSPNDIELHVYTDKEWDMIINMGDMIDPLSIPDPKNEFWRCPSCERLYVFDGNAVIKRYVLEDGF